MARTRVGLDMDGVLCNFAKGFSQLAADLFQIPKCDSRQIFSWDWTITLPISNEDVNVLWKDIAHHPNWWFELDPLWTFDEYRLLQYLVFKHDVFILTSRPSGIPDPKTQTLKWLLQHGLEKVVDVYITSRKAQMAKELALEYFIDDYPNTCLLVHREGIPQVFLLERKYNSPIITPPYKITRSLEEFLSLILYRI